MRIGIAYDTQDMYDIDHNIYYDFADAQSIISLKNELESLNYTVDMLGNAQQIKELLKNNQLNCDIVYNTVEGIASRNREGIIPALLETYNIPYIGTDAFGLSLTLNKDLTRLIAQRHGINVANGFLVSCLDNQNTYNKKLKQLNFPIIIKPNYEGNSSGITVCNDIDEATKQIQTLLDSYHTDILCEEFIYGSEITIPYIDSNPYSIWDVTTVDVQRAPDFWLDTNWKQNGDYHNVILDLDIKTKLKFEYAVKTLFQAIGCRDFCRFDFRLTDDNTIYFIEANPLPALFKGGSFDVVGQKYGYSYGETIELIINTACNRLSIPKI